MEKHIQAPPLSCQSLRLSRILLPIFPPHTVTCRVLLQRGVGFSTYARSFQSVDEHRLKQNLTNETFSSVQFSSVSQSCPTLCDPMNRSTPGLPVHHQLPEFTQTHVHWVSDAIQPSHPPSSPSPPAPNPSSIRVFSNESTLCMRWPKYWSFRMRL